MAVVRVAIVGGGVGGCATLRGLREHLQSATRAVEVEVFEMGRGLGGRTATRRTRAIKWMQLDHGAPHFHSSSPELAPLLDALTKQGGVRCVSASEHIIGRLNNEGIFVPEELDTGDRLYLGQPGIHTLAEALATDHRPHTTAAAVTARVRSKTVVHGLQAVPTKAGMAWSLLGKDDSCLGQYDWLVFSSTGVAHPRWSAVFGGTPPLERALQALKANAAGVGPELAGVAAAGQAAIAAVLKGVGSIGSLPVSAVMLAFEAGSRAARALAALPFAVVQVRAMETKDHVDSDNDNDKDSDDTSEGKGGLAKIVVGRINGTAAGDSHVTIVLHSTHAFAAAAAATYGRSSTAARIGGAASSVDREQALCGVLLADAVRALRPHHGEAAAALEQSVLLCNAPTDDTTTHRAKQEGLVYGPEYHRWGAAFPTGLLPASVAHALPARLLCAGDWVETASSHCGSTPTKREDQSKHSDRREVERALKSGLAAGEALAKALDAPIGGNL